MNRKTVHSQSVSSSAIDFSLVSYNILSDVYITPDSYQYLAPELRSSLGRHELLTEELRQLDPDILCMQEVTTKYFHTHLEPFLKQLEYSGVFIERTGSHKNGLATFYKTRLFELEDERVQVYKNSYKQILKSMSEMGDDERDALLDYLSRDTVAQYVKLKHIHTGRLLSVGNTHIIYEDFNYKDIQCLEIVMAFKGLQEFITSPSEAHLMCGDFNQTPDMPGYELSSSGKLSHSTLADLHKSPPISLNGKYIRPVDMLAFCYQHSLPSLKSAYKSVQGYEPELTCCVEVDNELFSQGTLDYIWYSSDSVECTSVLESIDEVEARRCTALPDPFHASDHVPLKATFTFIDEE